MSTQDDFDNSFVDNPGYSQRDEGMRLPAEYEPVSTLGFIGLLLLTYLPVVNLICCIIWAFGGCKKVNMRNFARAWLVVGIITTVLFFLLAVAFMSYAVGVMPGELDALFSIVGEA